MLRPQNFMRLHQSSRRDYIDALLFRRFDQRLPYWNPFDLLFLEPFSEVAVTPGAGHPTYRAAPFMPKELFIPMAAMGP